MKYESHIGGVRVGDRVEFSGPNAQTVLGRCTKLEFGEYQGDYATITVETVDGMSWEFGTGGHLGNTWTTYDGADEWFCHNFDVASKTS